MKKRAIVRPSALALAAAISVVSLGISAPARAELTGNIGLFSKYVLRGITNNAENDNTAVQGGVDWAGPGGVYLGYWGSNLDYGDTSSATGFENDFYGGWAGELGPVNVNVGLIYYHYLNVSDSDAPELTASVGFGPVTLGLKYLLQDVAWGNAGDTYLTVGYTQKLLADFNFSAVAGFYRYEDSGDFEASLGTTEDANFRHLDLTLSHPIGNTGADASLTYIHGGKTRSDTDLDNALVLGVKYAFDL